MERVARKHVHYHMKNRQPVRISCMTRGTQTRDLSQPRGVGWGGRAFPEGGDIGIPMANSC